MTRTEANKGALTYLCEAQKDVSILYSEADISLNFEYLHDAYWYYDATDKNVFWTYEEESLNGVPLDYEFSYEVNHIEYEGVDYTMLDVDDGCGSRHLKLVFSEAKRIMQLVEM